MKKSLQYRDCLTAYGVAQSIAIKEFHDYLQLTPDERYTDFGDKLFNEGCETLKLHTRQYSRRQRRWIKQHLLGGNTLIEVCITFICSHALYDQNFYSNMQYISYCLLIFHRRSYV